MRRDGDGDSGDDGMANQAQLHAPHNLLVLANGDVLVADTLNHRIRKIDAKTGKISTFAGTGEAGFSGDGGPALQARFGGVYCLALDRRANVLYVDDLDNRRIRKIKMKTGIVSTAAGNGMRGTPRDGDMATNAPLQDPRAVAVNSKGNLYILERSGNALRQVDNRGRIKTVAGTGKSGGVEDGPALSATLRGPKHLTVDHDDNVLIADSDNHAIRKLIVREGQFVTVAGTGEMGEDEIGGAPTAARLNQPHGVYVDSGGMIYICDSLNNRVVRNSSGVGCRYSVRAAVSSQFLPAALATNGISDGINSFAVRPSAPCPCGT